MQSKARGAALGISFALMILAASIAGCLFLKEEGDNEMNNEPPISDWTGPYLDERNATDSGIEDIISANNQFGMDILQKLYSGEEGNVFISPYSIFTALSMTYEGAEGTTEEEMKEVMHLPDNDAERLGSFAKVQNDINKGSDQYELSTANTIWPRMDLQMKDRFLNTIRSYYYGNVTELDYAADPEAARETINTWVEERTHDRIQDLIPPDVLDALTYMVLTNAIYFKGEWVYEFNEDDTTEKTFQTPDGQVTVDMMSLKVEEEDTLPYYEDDDLQALELPYKGDELSMILVLPRDGDMDGLISDLDAEKFQNIRSGLQDMEGTVWLPKFKLETKYELVPTMKELGMNAPFGDADFSGISDQGAPYISNIIHQTFIEVDEKGTEAAAATAVVMRELSAEGFYFNANQPFLFMIQQKGTGNILFTGIIRDPTA
ncbi:MAG: serpin family protein [Thermoplasmatota archaeon]